MIVDVELSLNQIHSVKYNGEYAIEVNMDAVDLFCKAVFDIAGSFFPYSDCGLPLPINRRSKVWRSLFPDDILYIGNDVDAIIRGDYCDKLENFEFYESNDLVIVIPDSSEGLKCCYLLDPEKEIKDV